MKTLADPGAPDALIARIARLRPDSARQWGAMSAHATLCHLADPFRGVLGERPVSAVDIWFSRPIVKFIYLERCRAASG